MGCAQSRIENEEAVARCKDRRSFMTSAVSARNAFAAAHFSYTMSLKNTGAALSDFAHGEAPVHDHPLLRPSSVTATTSATASTSAAAAPPIDNLLPPPPLPDFSPSPLHRSSSMPDLPPKYIPATHPNEETIKEEAEVACDSPPATVLHRHSPSASASAAAEAKPAAARRPPPPPMPDSTWDYFFAMDESIAPPPPPPPTEIHPDTPVKAVKVQENEEVLETPEKLVMEPPPPPPPTLPPKAAKKGKVGGGGSHQHSESAGALEVKKGKMVASAAPGVSLMQVLTELDDHFLKASESAHEVSKMLEANRMHYHSNFADNRGHIDHSARVMRVITWNRSFKGIPNGNDAKDDFFDSDEWETHATVLDKMLAWEKKLYKEVKAGELMKIEYQRKVALLNKQKKRVELLKQLKKLKQLMAIMWGTMYQHHVNQLKITMNLKALDISNAAKETSEHHYDRTSQLYEMAKEWQAQFEKLVIHQKEYIQILNSWLKLSIIPIESSLKEKVSSPSRPHQPPIQALLHAWYDHLEKLPDDLAKSAISSFAAILNTIMTLQQEELKQKERCEEIRKEYTRKVRTFEDWYHKHPPRAEEADPVEGTEGTNPKDPVAERRFQVEQLKSKVDEEEDAHKKLCKQVREKSLGSLKTHLPELFRAMSEFALACSEMYKELRFISQPQSQGAN